MTRDEILEKAKEFVSTDRDIDYGDPLWNHNRIASLWSVILNRPVKAEEVVACMIAVKLSRLINSKWKHDDSWIDVAGYAALAGEISKRTVELGYKND